MTTPSYKFAEHYAQMSNDELLRLAAQKDSLLEVARHALGNELARRGFGSGGVADYEKEEAQRLEHRRKETISESRNVWRRRSKTLLYVMILFGGDLLTVWGISNLFNLPAEAVRILTNMSLKCALGVAVLGIAFAGRWVNLKTTLATAGIFSLALFLWVFWARNPIGAPRASENKPSELQDTLQWLEGATEAESADGMPPYHHYGFRSNGGCNVTITETRLIDGETKDFGSSVFSLKDIDPGDILVEDLGAGPDMKMFQGQFAVRLHTRNYQKAIDMQGPNITELHAHPNWSRSDSVTLFTNSWFAPRFAKALKRAVELCGGNASSN